MRSIYVLIICSLLATNIFAQSIPTVETTFSIHKNEIQQFSFSLQKGYTLRAIIIQKGIDLEITVYKKGDTVKLGYFDSPNGEYGPEKISFESPADGNYSLVVDPLPDDTAREGKYSIRLKSINILQAIHDTSFSNGSGISTIALDKIKIENLTNLGMLWGFLKYHHPSIASGDHNWDADLFRVLPIILSAQTKEEANSAMEKWVDDLGKPDTCKTCKSVQYDSTIKLLPDYGFLFNKGNLKSSLVEKLNYIKNNRNLDSMVVEVQRDNKLILITIPCLPVSRLNVGIDFNPYPKDSSYKMLNGNIGYLFPGRYKNSQLPAIKKMFENTRGIIIDMRCYPSEFMPFTFGHYIKSNASPFVKFTTGDVNNPGLFTLGPPYSNGEPNPDYYKGPIVEIVNAVSQSQAEYTTMAFQSAPNVTVIGSTTAGADGNVSPIILPGGIYTLISGIGVYYVNGEETQRKGIRIDMELKPTIESIKDGKDMLIEKAIEIINAKNPQH